MAKRRRGTRKRGRGQSARWTQLAQRGGDWLVQLGRRLQAGWRRNKLILRTWALFLIAIVVLVGGLFGFRPSLAPALTHGTAQVTAWALWLIGAGGQAQGTLVSSSIFTAEIVMECTAVYALMFMLAAVVAYPCRWRTKLIGVAVMTPAIFVINLVRLVTLFYIGAWYPSVFDTAHLLVWQSLMIFLAVLIWLVWAAKLAPKDDGAQPA